MRSSVERRREPRYSCNQTARLIDLRTGEAVEVTIVNVSGRGLQVKAAKALALSTPVRIDHGDNLMLGDICYSRDDGPSALCGIRLAHSLTGSAALLNLMKRVESASEPRPARTPQS